MTTNLTNLFRKFHNDEEGLEALQVVMIIAIAAMIMIVAATVGQTGRQLDEDPVRQGLIDKDLASSTASNSDRCRQVGDQVAKQPAT